jgi:hypothetical protein
MRAAAERGTTMINNISESALRIATKIDPSGAIHDREASQQKAKDVRDARPVEGSEQSAHTQKQDPRKEEGSSRYLLEERHVVFEKYDKNGDLILRIPPSQTPVSTVA